MCRLVENWAIWGSLKILHGKDPLFPSEFLFRLRHFRKAFIKDRDFVFDPEPDIGVQIKRFLFSFVRACGQLI
jgi:hypothetical protein